ncbi:MAG: hypothetical protein RIF36_24950 [Imperialibacter sp.]|uniref:hypothetical protein n=1 Tax=Imperialibacter sp. TaxID=2038411 RepID=UPI0032EBA1F4
MTKKELLSIAIKIFGLYYFVSFAQHITEFLFLAFGDSLFGNGQLDSWIVYSGISLTALTDLAFAYFATFKTELITDRISKSDTGTVELTTSKTDLIEVTLAMIAVVAIVFAIPDILAGIVDNIYFHNHDESVFWTPATKTVTFRSVFTLFAGIFLLLNSRNFAKRIVGRGQLDDRRDEEKER